MKRVDWHPEKFTRQLEGHQAARLDKAAIDLRNHIVKAFPDSGIKNATKGQRRKATKGQRRKAAKGRPGQIPLVQTGLLRSSMTHDQPDQFVRRVGPAADKSQADGGTTIADIALWLELGTRKMAAHPFLRPGLEAKRADIGRILTTP